MMKTSDRGIIALMAHEGIVPGPYRDSKGVWTYGIGHTAAAGSPDPKAMPRGMPDDVDAAMVRVFDVFRKDLARYESAVSRAITASVSQHEFDAAVSFHFNTGAIHRASWVAAFNKGDVKGAYLKFMNWSKPREIIPRRMAELKLFRDGVHPDAPLNVWGVDKSGKVIWKPVKRLTPTEVLAHMRGGVRPDVDHNEEPPAAPWWVHIIQSIARMFK